MKLTLRHKRHSSRCKWAWREEMVDSTPFVSATGFTSIVKSSDGSEARCARVSLGDYTLILSRQEVIGLKARFEEILAQ